MWISNRAAIRESFHPHLHQCGSGVRFRSSDRTRVTLQRCWCHSSNRHQRDRPGRPNFVPLGDSRQPRATGGCRWASYSTAKVLSSTVNDVRYENLNLQQIRTLPSDRRPACMRAPGRHSATYCCSSNDAGDSGRRYHSTSNDPSERIVPWTLAICMASRRRSWTGRAIKPCRSEATTASNRTIQPLQGHDPGHRVK